MVRIVDSSGGWAGGSLRWAAEASFARGEIGIGGGEAQEIVLAEEERWLRAERVEIQRPGAGVDVASQKGRAEVRCVKMRYS